MATRQNIAPPNLVIAPDMYERKYQEQLNNVQRLFYNSVANRINSPVPYGSFLTSGTIKNEDVIGSGTLSANKERLVPFSVDTGSYQTKIGGVSSSRIYVAETGVYNIQFSAQCNLAVGSNKSIYFWLKQNGVSVPATAGSIAIGGSTPEMAVWNWVVTLKEKDYIELAWSSSDTHAQLLEETNLINPVRPDVPAVILTVTWVSLYNASVGIS